MTAIAVRSDDVVASVRAPALAEIEDRFLSFARAHAVGSNPAAAMDEGRFAATPSAARPDLMGALDFAYAAFILGVLDRITTPAGRGRWIDGILSFQDADGWFRMSDRQRHGVEHGTAYALGALQILSGSEGSVLAGRLRPFRDLATQLAAAPDAERAPVALTAIERVHFWRGAHRVAGVAAIVGAVDDLGLSTGKLVGVADADGWLRGWWQHFAARTSADGYWHLGPAPLRAVFTRLYRLRHDPALGSMGGAAHLYWIAERLGVGFPHPAGMIEATARLAAGSGLYEDEPYCVDLDGNFLIARALRQLPDGGEPVRVARRALTANRDAVVQWFLSRPPDRWNPNSHKLPGAFAAVAEADLALDGVSRWRDVFDVTWWL